MKICAELASCLSISLASARRQVEVVAGREGVKDLQVKKDIAKRLLKDASARQRSGEGSSSNQLDELLTAVAEEENFMIED